jgi:hypothetical protein
MTISRFQRKPHIEYVGGKRPWRLVTECAYITEVPVARKVYQMGVIHIPAGYQTDLASVPRIPGVYWRVGNTAVLPAIVHDYLYEYGRVGLTRKAADEVFLEAMEDEDDPPWWTTRRIMYRAVRLGGWRGWNKYRKERPE